MSAVARDLVTRADGSHSGEVARLEATVDISDDRRLRDLTVTPPLPAGVDLVGVSLRGGFRPLVADRLGELDGRPVALLLFDLPTIIYLNGYADMRRRLEAGEEPGAIVPPAILPVIGDICAGWATDGPVGRSVAAGRGVPLQDATSAPPLDDPADPLAWHGRPPLAPSAMRRERRLDLTRTAGGWQVEGFLRDTFGEPDGTAVVLHEYVLHAAFDADLQLADLRADPRVLPQSGCPVVVSELHRLVGTPAGELRSSSRDRLAGTAGCTHLNDLIACLDDVRALVPAHP